MPRTARASVCVCLLLLAAVPPVFAGDREEVRRERPERSAFSLLWEAVSKFVPVVGKSRGSMDPDGVPAPSLSSTTQDEGDSRGSMDPNG
jgi:hypothetical protein